MEILSEDDVWEPHAFCVKCDGNCLTPHGQQRETIAHKTKLKWYVGGTVCTDVSLMGNRMALLGESSQSLAIFLTLIQKNRPHVVTHECTSLFSQFLFGKFLTGYTVHQIQPPQVVQQHSALKAGFQSNTWLLSPHQFGWPCFRPRRGQQNQY